MVVPSDMNVHACEGPDSLSRYKSLKTLVAGGGIEPPTLGL